MSADFFAAFGAAVRALRARLDRALVSHGLRLGQYQVLRVLWEEDGLTPRELSHRLGVEMPTVTRTVQRMLRDRLARREAHPSDARSVRVLLTQSGRALEPEIMEVCRREAELALTGFSAEERAALVEFLLRINANVRR